MAPKNKKAGSVDEPENKATSLIAFRAIEITGDQENVRIRKKDLVLSTKMILALQGMLWQKAAKITIKKIVCMWCPLVEPGTSASINITMSYDIGEETDNMNAEENIISITGVISETLRVDVFPTQPILKTSDMALYIPWSASAEIPDTLVSRNNCVLGVLKLWCHLGISTYFSKDKPTRILYKEPQVTWNNLHYPYYVPFYIIKKVRGLQSIMWRDTDQMKKFKSQVALHLDGGTYSEVKYLTMMQILSKDDASKVIEMTSVCHALQGGLCTCKGRVEQFIASALLNNHGRCNNHGEMFDRVGRDIMTGTMKVMGGHPEIKF